MHKLAIFVLLIFMLTGCGVPMTAERSAGEQTSKDIFVPATCRNLTAGDIKDVTFTTENWDGPRIQIQVTNYVLKDYKSLHLIGSVDFQPGWYYFDNENFNGHNFARFVGTKDKCPEGANIYKQ